MTEPGWYHATGDPDGTTRYWDGTAWVGEATGKTGSGDVVYYAASVHAGNGDSGAARTRDSIGRSAGQPKLT